jgi:hypothetical protein
MNGRFCHYACCVALNFLLLPTFTAAQHPDYEFIISGATWSTAPAPHGLKGTLPLPVIAWSP